MRKFLVVFVVLLCLFSSTIVSASYNLEGMSRSELNALQNAIVAELEKNHKTNSTEEGQISSVVKQEVESLFSKKGTTVSWAWVNYEYTKDWNFYTFKTHIDYRDSNNSKQRANVYAEAYDVGDSYQLFYLKIGEEAVFDNRGALPIDYQTPLDPSAVSLIGKVKDSETKKAPAPATVTPIKPIKVTAGELIKAYDNNEVKADATYKGKMLTVTGKVNNISKSHIEIGTGDIFEWGITCYFNKDQNDKIATLDKGDRISVTGECSGKSFLSVTLRNCIIVK